MKLVWFKIAMIFFVCFCSYWIHPFVPKISSHELCQIAQKIWHNECRGRVDQLLFWNEAEAFPSCGIAHFIWMPAEHQRQFEETFPVFIRFCKEHSVPYPSWLMKDNVVLPCPWPDRQAFMRDQHSYRYRSLKAFLETSLSIQAEFIVHRFQVSVAHMLKRLSSEKRNRIEFHLKRIAAQPSGLYALIDYVNFKGSGTSSRERYNDVGWGLLQVLEGMCGKEYGTAALKEFVHNAKAVLARRIKNAPSTKDERRFLPGWYNRLDTYVIS